MSTETSVPTETTETSVPTETSETIETMETSVPTETSVVPQRHPVWDDVVRPRFIVGLPIAGTRNFRKTYPLRALAIALEKDL